MKIELGGGLALALLMWPALLAFQTPTSNVDLARGITLVREGDLEGAVATLTRVIRDLSADPVRVKELAQAHLHLGIAYAQLDDEKAARGSFKEALRLDPTVHPEPNLSPAKVSRLFEDVSRSVSASPAPDQAASAAPSASDVLACNALATATAAAAFEEYLRQFPNGACAGFARVKLAALGAPSPAPKASPAASVSPMDLERACERGETAACSSLGMMYQAGRGVQRDEAAAVRFYQRACNGGGQQGCVSLGVMYQRGSGVAKDEAAAARLYQGACDSGEQQGCASLGAMYQTGSGVAKDERRAAGLYQGACDAGEQRGCVGLGLMYQTGSGVAKDKARAARLYEGACAAGEPMACALAAMQHKFGDGVRRDGGRSRELMSRAVELSRRACEAGDNAYCVALERIREMEKVLETIKL